jgi:hypothetical protein
MALPIAETPILYGEDAERFTQRMREVEAGLHPVSKEDYERARKTYEDCIKKWGKDFL